MQFIDPAGDIKVLREEMINLVKSLAERSSPSDRTFLLDELLPELRSSNDAYLRRQALGIVKAAQKYGVKVEVAKQ